MTFNSWLYLDKFKINKLKNEHNYLEIFYIFGEDTTTNSDLLKHAKIFKA